VAGLGLSNSASEEVGCKDSLSRSLDRLTSGSKGFDAALMGLLNNEIEKIGVSQLEHIHMHDVFARELYMYTFASKGIVRRKNLG